MQLISSTRVEALDGVASSPRIERCQMLRTERRLIGRHLGFHLCADPAWDMLLELYQAGAKDIEIPALALAAAANVSQSTALRYIKTLEQNQLATRTPDYRDSRRILIALTSLGVRQLETIFDRMRG